MTEIPTKFYVDLNHRAKGFGQKVLNEIEKFYLAKGMNEIKLVVNRENFKSINFYFKNGFKIEDLWQKDIGEGYFMTDFLMTKKYSK